MGLRKYKWTLASVALVGAIVAPKVHLPTALVEPIKVQNPVRVDCGLSPYVRAEIVADCQDYRPFIEEFEALSPDAVTDSASLKGFTLSITTTYGLLGLLSKQFYHVDCRDRISSFPQAVFDNSTNAFYVSLEGKVIETKFSYAGLNGRPNAELEGMVVELLLNNCFSREEEPSPNPNARKYISSI